MGYDKVGQNVVVQCEKLPYEIELKTVSNPRTRLGYVFL